MSDISTGQNFTTGMSVTAPVMNNIIGQASINSSFVSTKNVKATLSSNDSMLLVDNGGNFWRIVGSTLADGLFNAEPNFARIAVGALQAPCPIINGDMQIAQRQTSFTALGAAAVHTIDKWSFSGNDTARVTVSQNVADIPQSANSPHTTYSYKITVTTSEASIPAGTVYVAYQDVERQFAKVLFDGVHSLCLWMKSSITGTFCVYLKNNVGGVATKSYVAECVITSANVWQRFAFPNIAALPTGSGVWGTLDTDGAYELGVCVAAGSTFQTTAGSWNTGNFMADANQTNLLATNGNTLELSIVQHEAGAICTPFIWTPFDISLLRCKRYFSTSYDYGVYPGAISTNGEIVYQNVSTTAPTGFVKYPVSMRAAGVLASSLNIYSPATGAVSKVRDNTGAVDTAVSAVVGSGLTGFAYLTATAVTSGNISLFHYANDVDF